MAQPQHPWTNVSHFDKVLKALAVKIMAYCKDEARGDVKIIHGNFEDGEVLFGFYYDRAPGGVSHGLQIHIEERGGRVGKGLMVDDKQRWWGSDPPTPFSSGGMSRFLTILEGISTDWEANTHGVVITTVAADAVVPVTTYMYAMVGFTDTLITLRVGDKLPVAIDPVPASRVHYTLGSRGLEMEGDVLVATAESSGNFVISQLPNAQNQDSAIVHVIDVIEAHANGQVEAVFTTESDGNVTVAGTTEVGVTEDIGGATVDWFSTDAAIASVAVDGTVTGVAAGEAKIFGRIVGGARDGEVTTYLVISVTEPVVT